MDNSLNKNSKKTIDKIYDWFKMSSKHEKNYYAMLNIYALQTVKNYIA